MHTKIKLALKTHSKDRNNGAAIFEEVPGHRGLRKPANWEGEGGKHVF